MAEKRPKPRPSAGALEKAANPKYLQLLRLLADILSMPANIPDGEDDLPEGSQHLYNSQ